MIPGKLVTSHEIFSKKTISVDSNGTTIEAKRFADNSLFSKRIFGDMDSKEEYSCECGNLHGKFYDGAMCQKCQTPVSYVGMTVDKQGWIDLSLSEYNENGELIKEGNGCSIIEYISYFQLEKIIGRENLRNIIHIRNTITINGELDTEEIEELRSASPEAKYYYYGIEDFYKNYNEILDYYNELKGNKFPEIYNFLKNKNEVFTSKIPVINILLRPAMRTADGLKLDDINIKYQNILKNLEMLKDPNMIKLIRDSIIEQIQSEFMMLSEEILEAIKSKNGIIRNQICGTRINFSARNIISPAPAGTKIDEIILPYLTFLHLWKFEIINVIERVDNISLKEAEKVWFNASLKYDKKIWKIMKKMVTDNEVGVILNRNPTIAIGSILYLRVSDVKNDFSDMTMSLSNNILTGLGGDYDGDVLNLISIKDKSTRRLFKNVFSPIHLMIDPNSGKFNDNLNLERDQVLGINSLLE